MITPFIFGKIAKEENFTNREQDTLRLVTNFLSGTNTILISPRRWGKSSLVNKAATKATEKDKKIRFCFIDLYNLRGEEEFYRFLAQEILRATSSKYEELLESARNFLGRLLPQVTFSPEPNSAFSLSLNWDEVRKQPDEILNLAENIAKEKNIRLVICIDEFQNISHFGDSLNIQKKLRSHWQKHTHTSYCLYGSKRNMLKEVFASYGMPFYKFGDILFLQKITKEDWIPFITGRFTETGKFISNENAGIIADLVECHPYYVQQLAQQTWLRTDKNCDTDTVTDAHENLINQLDFLFQSITDSLSNTQINFLKALLMGVKMLSAKSNIKAFDLGTSANVSKIKKTLENKEIIDVLGNKIELLDPIYKSWLKKKYFKI